MEEEYTIWGKRGRGRKYALILILILVGVHILFFAIDPNLTLRVLVSSIFLLPAFIIIAWATYRQQKKRYELEKAKCAAIEKTSDLINVACPYCNNTFQILKQEKPFNVVCPKCSRESRLK